MLPVSSEPFYRSIAEAEPHSLARLRMADGLGIDHAVLCALRTKFHERRLRQPHFVTKLRQLRKLSDATLHSLSNHQARRQLLEVPWPQVLHLQRGP